MLIRWWSLFFILCFSFIFSKDYIDIPDKCQLTVLTPTLSKRQIAKIQLKNDLQAYIISDPNADQSGAALVVRIGSWNNPNNALGIAHFVEHMLFQGTATYPQDDFMKFIKDNNGQTNAYTSSLTTAYMFSCNPQAFEPALDRFSHFFIDPLFTNEALKKEIHAVHEEYLKNIENDLWRTYIISKELANPNHPYHNFTVGNLSTLSHVTHDEMKQWFDNNYSANLMTLMIYSPAPLDELINLVVKDFSAIKNKNIHVFQTNESVFLDKTKNKIVYVKPFQKMNQLILSFSLPKQFAHDECLTTQLISYTLQRGQKNNLLELLKKQQLATGFQIFISEQIIDEEVMAVIFELTEKGVVQYKKVIDEFFQTIASFKKEKIPHYLFTEKNTMAKINYEYQPHTDPFEYLYSQTENIALEDLSTYPQKQTIASCFNPQSNTSFLNFLSPKNCEFFLIADPKLTGVKMTQKEKYSEAEYAIVPIESQDMEKWTTTSANPDIHLPKKNPFLPTNLTLLKQNKDDIGLYQPKLIVDTSLAKVYYAKDDRYFTPTSHMTFSFQSPLFDGSILSQILLDLYTDFLYTHAEPIVYTAASAGIFVNCNTTNFAMNLTLQGYSEKTYLVLEKVLDIFKTALPTKEEFNTLKEKFLDDYQNAQKQLPCYQSIEIMQHIITPQASLNQSKYTCLKDLHYDDFLSFCQQALKKIYIEGMIIGNLTEQNAQKIYHIVQSSLNVQPFLDQNHYSLHVLTSYAQQDPDILSQTLDVSGSGMVMLLNQGPSNFEKKCCQQILSASISEAYFSSLRSEQKMGYIVKSTSKQVRDRLFQVFFIQSGSNSCDALMTRTQTFCYDYSQNIEKYLSQERFENIKNNKLIKVKNGPKNLYGALSNLFYLAFNRKDFEWDEKLIAAYEKLDYPTFIRIAKSWLTNNKNNQLFILSQGQLDVQPPSVFSSTPVETWVEKATYQAIKQ